MEFITPSTLPVNLKKKQFFKYNLGKFLKYITFSSCSLIIFESLPKLYLKIAFFLLNVKMEGVNSIYDLGALARLERVDWHFLVGKRGDTRCYAPRLIQHKIFKSRLLR